MSKPTLLILAAGMGSRYGGLKQMDPVGPAGEIVLDYSIFDAVRAGFGYAGVLIAALAPVALIFRYGVLSPLSVIVPGLRRIVVERYSALAINPQFRRRMPEREAAKQWNRIEAACAIWAMSLIALVATGTIPAGSKSFGV